MSEPRMAGTRKEFEEYLRNYDRKARGAGSQKDPKVDRFSALDVRRVFDEGRDRGLSKAAAAEEVLDYASDLIGRSKMGGGTRRALDKLRGYLGSDEPDQQVGVNPFPGAQLTPPVANPDRPGGFAGTFQNYLGGDPSDPRNFSTLGQGFDPGGRPFGYVRTQDGGVAMGMPSFRGNVGMPQYGAEPESMPEGQEEQEEGSSGSNFLNSVLEGLIPTLGPVVGTELGGFVGDLIGGGRQQDESPIMPYVISGEPVIGDFGPFTSSARSRAGGILSNIVDIFPRAIV